jgi:predicted nucleic acid-binding protein
MSSPLRLYWDACIFLSYLNGEPGRAPAIEAVLDSASKGDVEIVTSTISITEVAFGAAEQQGQSLDPVIEKKIAAMWGPPVKLVEFHAAIAARAVELARLAITKGWALKPMDSIHLSTAEQLRVSVFHTYDAGLAKYGHLVRFAIEEPKPAAIQTDLAIDM